jgi:hypothetical protein
MSELEIWKDTEGGNDASPPDGAPENMLRSGLNNVIREMMAKLKRGLDVGRWFDPFYHYTVSRVDADTIRVAGFDATHILPADRRVKITDTSGPTSVEGYVVSSNFGDPDTTADILVDAAADIPVNADKLEVSMAALGRAAFKNFGSAAAEVVLGSDLIAAITENVSAKSAALKDIADNFGDPDTVPLYDQLGTVGQYDQGTDSGEVPLVSDLATIFGDLAFLDRPGRAYAEITNDWQTTADNLLPVPGLDNITIPGADGSKRYEVEILLYKGSSTTPEETSLRVGTSGDETDSVEIMMKWEPASALPEWLDFDFWGRVDWGAVALEDFSFLYRYTIQPEAGAKATIAVDPVDFADFHILEGSYVLITEIFGEA